jgi:hypothetical protein
MATADEIDASPAVEYPGVRLISRTELVNCARWRSTFEGKRKDRRYYELLEDTLPQGFDYRYFAISDRNGKVVAIQPFFLLDQDVIAGVSSGIGAVVDFTRRIWPRFLKMRTLMVGCVAGEGHLDGDEASLNSSARLLAASIVEWARDLNAHLIVLKEFPARYRQALRCFVEVGFTRVPSLPMTRLSIDYASFDDYMNRALNGATRRKLRKKFRAAVEAPPIEMSILVDATPIVGEIYPLYLQVYARSKLHFEKLTREYFCRIGQRMPDKVRYFVWRQDGRIVAFTLCMVEGGEFYAEYIGLDYAVALKQHLYHYAVRDMTSWAIANGYKWFCSSALNYDPKLHLRHSLDPIDLYVRHTSPVANAVLKKMLPFIEPTRYDPILKKFSNYADLWERS